MKKKNPVEGMSAKDYNFMVRCANDETPRDFVVKTGRFSKEQMEHYDDMLSKLKEERKTYPKAAYGPVESEW